MLGVLITLSCEKPGPGEEDIPEVEIVNLDASQIVGRWDWTSWGMRHTLASGEVLTDEIDTFSSFFVFYENGRFETSVAYGILVEGYWTVDQEGIHTFVKDEPLGTLLPIQYDGGTMTLKTPGSESAQFTCKKGVYSEFSAGYGTTPVDDYFKDQQNIDAFKQSIEKERAAFERALEELKAISLTRENWQSVTQVETLWFTSYSVMIRANQAIDALTAAGASPQAISEFRYLRAWSSYVRIVCWDYAASYWEHASRENTLSPIGHGAESILSCALDDLADVSGTKADELKAAISALKADYVPGKTLKSWGIVPASGSDLLPIPMSVLSTNMNQIQTPGW